MSEPWRVSKLAESLISNILKSFTPFDGNQNNYKSWRDTVKVLATHLKVWPYLIKAVPYSEIYSPPSEISDDISDLSIHVPFVPAAGSNAPANSVVTVPIATSGLSDDDLPNSQVADFYSITSVEQHNHVRDNLSNLYVAMWLSIKASSQLLSIANKDGAIDRSDAIGIFEAISSVFVSTSGLSIVSILCNLFTLCNQELPAMNSIISAIELSRDELAARSYTLDHVLMVSVLILNIRDPQLCDTLNQKVSDRWGQKGSFTWTEACTVARQYESDRHNLSSAHKSLNRPQFRSNNPTRTFNSNNSQGSYTFHTPSSTSTASNYSTSVRSTTAPEGTKALTASTDSKKDKLPPNPCYNCGELHWFLLCPYCCTKCKDADHLPKDCPTRKRT
jgi:hypothetical protein